MLVTSRYLDRLWNILLTLGVPLVNLGKLASNHQGRVNHIERLREVWDHSSQHSAVVHADTKNWWEP